MRGLILWALFFSHFLKAKSTTRGSPAVRSKYSHLCHWKADYFHNLHAHFHTAMRPWRAAPPPWLVAVVFNFYVRTSWVEWTATAILRVIIHPLFMQSCTANHRRHPRNPQNRERIALCTEFFFFGNSISADGSSWVSFPNWNRLRGACFSLNATGSACSMCLRILLNHPATTLLSLMAGRLLCTDFRTVESWISKITNQQHTYFFRVRHASYFCKVF